MKSAYDIASEFVETIDALNSVPGLMTSHDLGREKMARELLRIKNHMQTVCKLVDDRSGNTWLSHVVRTEWRAMRGELKNNDLWFVAE